MGEAYVHQQGMLVLRDGTQEMLLLCKTNDRNWLTGLSVEGHCQSITEETSSPCLIISIRGAKPIRIESEEVAHMLAQWLEHTSEWIAFVNEHQPRGHDDDDDDDDDVGTGWEDGL